MEAEGDAPDYCVCGLVGPIRPLLEAAKDRVLFFPAETPGGVTMEEWTRQVMTRGQSAVKE
jgi:hypothetical protein